MKNYEYITNTNSEKFNEAQNLLEKGEYVVKLIKTGINKTIGVGDKRLSFELFIQTYLDNEGKEVAEVRRYVSPNLETIYFDEFKEYV